VSRLHAVLFALSVTATAILAGCATKSRSYEFIVPQQMPDGTSTAEEREPFEEWLVDEAGGFTRLDAVEGAWRSPEGTVVREPNHLYLVTVPPGNSAFEGELRARIVEDFDQQEAWVQRR
jgi:hypothetical protein